MHSWRTTVGEGKGGSLLMGSGDGQNDQFPVGMRVLAVDDDPTCLRVLEAMLLRCGYNVTTTNQAASALELLRENKNRFDLVISDVHMPDMDGFSLLRKLKAVLSPSRKIKKVGHSLKKLQVVIDSVHGSGGGGGGIQFSSLYEKFIKTTSPENNTFSFFKPHDQPESSNLNPVIEGRFASRTSGSNSLSSSSCSQNSNSSQGCSSEQKQQCDRAHELVAPVEEAQPHEELQMDHCSLLPIHQHDFFRVKAVCGEERVIFRLHPTWGFQDFKQEIHLFGIADLISVDIKYLDDDFEWILITCDDDLKECIDVYKLSNAHTIKLSILHVAQLPTTRSSW